MSTFRTAFPAPVCYFATSDCVFRCAACAQHALITNAQRRAMMLNHKLAPWCNSWTTTDSCSRHTRKHPADEHVPWADRGSLPTASIASSLPCCPWATAVPPYRQRITQQGTQHKKFKKKPTIYFLLLKKYNKRKNSLCRLCCTSSVQGLWTQHSFAPRLTRADAPAHRLLCRPASAPLRQGRPG
jgi:hypothetical protein